LPLQQSASMMQALPAVWQPLPSCAQVPLWQAVGPLQQGVPPAVQLALSEIQAALLQTLLVQLRLQQSLGPLHASPVALHIDAPHRCVVGSHTLEQHSVSAAQVAPPARQVGPPSSPPSSPLFMSSVTPVMSPSSFPSW
jgi:hypothetical protein